MSECNACYLGSTNPQWVALLVTKNRQDRPCTTHKGNTK